MTIKKFKKKDAMLSFSVDNIKDIKYNWGKLEIEYSIFTEKELSEFISLAKRKEIFKEVEGDEQARDTEVAFTEINKLAETIEAIISENPDLMKNKVIKENATLFGKIKEIRKG